MLIPVWITDAPKILKDLMPARVTWALGYQEHLDCPVDANPPVREYSWKKNTYLVSFSSDHITLLPNGSLLVKSVQHSDAGAYSCMPVSSIGNSQSSPLVQVIVQGKANGIYIVCRYSFWISQMRVSVMVHCIGIFFKSLWPRISTKFLIQQNDSSLSPPHLSVHCFKKYLYFVWE